MAVLKIKNQNNEWETLIGLSGTTDYNDLKNKPTIPDELSDLQDDSSHRTVTDTEKNNWNGKYAKPSGGIPKTDLAEAVQTSLGKADSAVQDLSPITNLIPSEATSSNQLADKNFVNSSISTATATFRGTYNLVSDLDLPITATESDISTALNTAISTKDNNDYCFVQIPTDASTPTEISRIDRYKYDSTAWSYEYSLNNSGFTASQWAAINSGITSSLVTSFGNKYDKPNGGIPYTDLNSAVQTSLDKADTALQSQTQADWTETDTSSVAYIQHKPPIPAAQVNSDWDSNSGVSQILNKPTIPSITFRQW